MPPRQTNGGQAASGAAAMSRRAALEEAAKRYAEHAGVTVCHVCAQRVVCERYVQYDPMGAVAKQRATEARDRTQGELETEMKRSEEEREGLRGRSGSTTRAVSASISQDSTEDGKEDMQQISTIGQDRRGGDGGDGPRWGTLGGEV